VRTKHREELEQLLTAGGGVIRRSEHRGLATTLDRMLRTKELIAVLPGVYAPTGAATELPVRIAAVGAWNADAVVVGRAAASVTYWPQITFDVVDVAVRVARKFSSEGFRLQRRTIPVDWIRDVTVGARTVRVAKAALTAVELADELGGEPIDTVLRTGHATLDDLRAALDAVKGRGGNVVRRRLLWESRDTPWAESERLAHQLLREAGILGWTGNEGIHLNGRTYYVDICFRRLKVRSTVATINETSGLSSGIANGRMHSFSPGGPCSASPGKTWMSIRNVSLPRCGRRSPQRPRPQRRTSADSVTEDLPSPACRWRPAERRSQSRRITSTTRSIPRSPATGSVIGGSSQIGDG